MAVLQQLFLCLQYISWVQVRVVSCACERLENKRTTSLSSVISFSFLLSKRCSASSWRIWQMTSKLFACFRGGAAAAAAAPQAGDAHPRWKASIDSVTNVVERVGGYFSTDESYCVRRSAAAEPVVRSIRPFAYHLSKIFSLFLLHRHSLAIHNCPCATWKSSIFTCFCRFAHFMIQSTAIRPRRPVLQSAMASLAVAVWIFWANPCWVGPDWIISLCSSVAVHLLVQSIITM